MKSSRDDVLDLFDHAGQRFRERMAGLGDDEWYWQPSPDDRLSLRWRLRHIAGLLREERNAAWLGAAPPPPRHRTEVSGAAAALADVDDAFTWFREVIAALAEEDFAGPIGPVAGPFGAATRRSFALHIADELIHHTAEAAVLRDLYAAIGARPAR